MKTEETLKVEAGKWTLFLLSSYFNRIRGLVLIITYCLPPELLLSYSQTYSRDDEACCGNDQTIASGTCNTLEECSNCEDA